MWAIDWVSLLNWMKGNGIGAVIVLFIAILIYYGMFLLIRYVAKAYGQKIGHLINPNKVKKQDQKNKQNNKIALADKQHMHESINSCLTHLRTAFQADRATVWIYTNGQRTRNNIGLDFQICMYQSIKANAPSAVAMNLKLPTAAIVTCNKYLLSNQNDVFVINNIDTVQMQQKNLFRFYKIKSAMVSIIRTEDNIPIGMMVLSWVFETRKQQFTSADKQTMMMATTRIGGYLQQYQKKHPTNINRRYSDKKAHV